MIQKIDHISLGICRNSDIYRVNKFVKLFFPKPFRSSTIVILLTMLGAAYLTFS
jgi:hypothetical protein